MNSDGYHISHQHPTPSTFTRLPARHFGKNFIHHRLKTNTWRFDDFPIVNLTESVNCKLNSNNASRHCLVSAAIRQKQIFSQEFHQLFFSTRKNRRFLQIENFKSGIGFRHFKSQFLSGVRRSIWYFFDDYLRKSGQIKTGENKKEECTQHSNHFKLKMHCRQKLVQRKKAWNL